MTHTLIRSGVAALALFAAPFAAHAADMPVKAPLYRAPLAAPAASWSGFYAGINRALIYGTGGLAYGRTSLSTAVLGPLGGLCGPTGLCAAASSGWQTGWAAGAGIEWALTRSLSLKAEYLHYDLGSRALLQFDPASPAIVFGSSAEFSGDLVRAGLNFKLDTVGAIVTRD